MSFCPSLNPAPAVGAESCGFGALGDSWKGGGVPPARSAEAPHSLPCQSSNNSAVPRPKFSPYQRKNAVIIRENLDRLIELFGVECIGFLTLTFAEMVTLKEANRRLNSMGKHVLRRHFLHWVCVREFTKGGRPHFHLIVVCRGDIREGFDFASYLAMAKLNRTPELRRKNAAAHRVLSRSLNPSPCLRGIWDDLRASLEKYGFGKIHELVPIRKPQAIALYVGGYIRKSMEMRPESAKGARLVSYSKDFPRKIVGHAWAFHTPKYSLWRRKVAVFAGFHGVDGHDGLAKAFGPKWVFWLRDLIQSINLEAFGSVDSDLRKVEMSSLDFERFAESLDVKGFSLSGSMHLYRPRLPCDSKGNPFCPSRALAGVFAFHCGSWVQVPPPAAVRVSVGRFGAPCRLSVALGGLTNLLP